MNKKNIQAKRISLRVEIRLMDGLINEQKMKALKKRYKILTKLLNEIPKD